MFSNETLLIPPWSRKIVTTGIAIGIPVGTYAKIAPRSGLASKGIDVAAGVVDRGYTGELKVLLCNNTSTAYNVYRDDKIAQLILHKIVDGTKVQTVTSLG